MYFKKVIDVYIFANITKNIRTALFAAWKAKKCRLKDWLAKNARQ